MAVALLLGLSIGALCRRFSIPSPAPTMLIGALLVLAMTSGYLSADRWLVSRQPGLRNVPGSEG